jgi:DNA-binding transcriptional ArsR family regulator
MFSRSVAASESYEETAPAAEKRISSIGGESAGFKQVAMVLAQSAIGRHLLRLKETYQVDIKFEEAGGSRFRKQENLIILDSSHDSVKAALFFAHEMQHVQAFYKGEQANPKSVGRQAFIEHKLHEEAKGMAVSMQMKMELEQLGFHVSNMPFPMEDYYREAYQAATERAWLTDNTLGRLELDAIGQAAGEKALFDAFISGQIQTSNTYDSYPKYYGHVWDEANLIRAYLRNGRVFSYLGNFIFDVHILFACLTNYMAAN